MMMGHANPKKSKWGKMDQAHNLRFWFLFCLHLWDTNIVVSAVGAS